MSPYRIRTEPRTCCPDCFANSWLRDYVKEKSRETGTCGTCRRRRRPLLPVCDLVGPFANLLSYYTPLEDPYLESGGTLIELIQWDWEVFRDDLVESGRAGALLESIMHTDWDDDSGEFPLSAIDSYIPRSRRWYHDTLADIWDRFCEQVIENPTDDLQLCDSGFHEFVLNEDLLGRTTIYLSAGTTLYRARLGFTIGPDNHPQPYSGPDIGPPPIAKATPGRANKSGRAVLYCADQEQTAIAEVRPVRGEYVSIAELYTLQELRIVDLSTTPDWPNPFATEHLSYEIEFSSLLEAFAEELAKPLRRRDDVADYLPSQKLAEFIEQAGIDGVRYPSAMAPDGTNIVLFNPLLVKIGPSKLVEISNIRIDYS